MKVPTPGPYSTNSLVFAQSTGLSMRSISVREEGMIEPTMTGRLRKPLKNIAIGPGAPRLRSRSASCSAEKLFMWSPLKHAAPVQRSQARRAKASILVTIA